jgi:putative ABC transport system permease protein
MLLTRLITWRSILTRRLRSLLSTFGIVLGVACMLAISATNQTALNSITRLFQNTSGRTNLEIHSADNNGSFPQSVLGAARSFRGIGASAPIVQLQVAMVEKESRKSLLDINFFGASTSGLLLYGIDPQLDQQVRDYKMVAGRFLSNNPSVYEVVLVSDFATEHKVKVDDRIAVQTSGGPARLRVVGLMAKDGPGQLNLGSFGVVSLFTAQRLKGQLNELDQVDLIASTDSANPKALEQLRLDLQARLGKGYSVVYPANQGQRMAQMLGGYQIGLNFMGAIALFVGAFLIYNAFSMTVIERTREFGLLRAIGLTSGQVIGQVLVEGLVLGVFGSVAGALLGILMTRGLVQLMSTILGQRLDAGAIPTDIVITSMAMGLGITLLASVLPAVQAGRISPLEALRLRGQRQGGWLVRFGFPVGLAMLVISAIVLVWNPFVYDVQYRLGSMFVFSLFIGAMLLIPSTTRLWETLTRKPMQWIYGSSGQIGTRNLERARLRTMLTAAALLVGVSMIVIMQGMTTSFSSDLRNWMEAYIGGDLYVNSSVPLKQELQSRFEAVHGVQAAANVRYFEVTWKRAPGKDEKINFMAVDPLAYTRVTRFAFSSPDTDVDAAVNALNQGRSVFISSVISEKYGVKIGDAIQLQARGGVVAFRVVGIVMDFYNQGMVVTGSWADMHQYFRLNDASMIMVKVQDGTSIENTRDAIDRLYGKRYDLSLESNRSIKERALSLMDQAFSMFDVLGIIAVIVAALGVVNTLSMSVIERTREIGMLRSIGMTRWQIVLMVLAEAGLLGIIGGLLGLAFGVLLTRIFLESMASMAGYSLRLIIPTRTILTGIIVALVVSQAAALFPALRAARTPVLEAIHYE